LHPDPALLCWRASISFTSFNGKFLMAAGKSPSVLNEKAAAQRVKGRSQAVAFKNTFCSTLFMSGFLLNGPSCFYDHTQRTARLQPYRTMTLLTVHDAHGLDR
jgi:hypothetical protein